MRQTQQDVQKVLQQIKPDVQPQPQVDRTRIHERVSPSVLLSSYWPHTGEIVRTKE